MLPTERLFFLSTWRTSKSTNYIEYDLYLKCKCWNGREQLLGGSHNQIDPNGDLNVLKPLLVNWLKQFSWSLASAGASLVFCIKHKLLDTQELAWSENQILVCSTCHPPRWHTSDKTSSVQGRTGREPPKGDISHVLVDEVGNCQT